MDCGSLVAMAGVDPKRSLEAVEVIMDEFRKVGNGKAHITQEELTKAKEYLKGHLVLELEDSRSVAGYYAGQELLEKEILNPDEVLQKIDAITLDQIVEMGTKYFKNTSLTLAAIGNIPDRQKLEKLVQL
jgi:predicted Zn-dependent peptidase